MKKKVLDESTARVSQRVRRKVSQEIVDEVRKRGSRGPEPGQGGRPPIDEPKDCKLTIPLSRRQIDELRKEADAMHITLTELARRKLTGK